MSCSTLVTETQHHTEARISREQSSSANRLAGYRWVYGRNVINTTLHRPSQQHPESPSGRPRKTMMDRVWSARGWARVRPKSVPQQKTVSLTGGQKQQAYGYLTRNFWSATPELKSAVPKPATVDHSLNPSDKAEREPSPPPEEEVLRRRLRSAVVHSIERSEMQRKVSAHRLALAKKRREEEKQILLK